MNIRFFADRCAASSRWLIILLSVMLSAFAGPLLAAAEDIYPRFRQGYLSSPENAFLLTGLCEKYAWQFPVRGQVKSYVVAALHLGNQIDFHFNADSTLSSCSSYNFEQAFSYRDGRILQAISYTQDNGELQQGIASDYKYFTDDLDRVEVWSRSPQGESSHSATYILDGFELTIINEKLRTKAIKVFDPQGRLVEVKSDYATVVYDYNDAGYIVAESTGRGDSFPQRSKLISYRYAADGNIEAMKTESLDSDYRGDYLLQITK